MPEDAIEVAGVSIPVAVEPGAVTPSGGSQPATPANAAELPGLAPSNPDHGSAASAHLDRNAPRATAQPDTPGAGAEHDAVQGNSGDDAARTSSRQQASAAAPAADLAGTDAEPAGDHAAAAIGWFGKIPAIGDFVERRLPSSFREPWDRWLRDGLALGEQRAAQHWIDWYLTFPIWRFVAPPGVLGTHAWAGIMLPSVDRVGRRFPLTIALPIASVAAAGGLAGLHQQLRDCCALAERALDGLPLDEFDGALRRLPSVAAPVTAASASVVASSATADLQRFTDQLLFDALAQRLLWWTEAADGQLQIERLPLTAEGFFALVADGSSAAASA